MPQPKQPAGTFQKVGECLYRYSSNGVYYARIKTSGNVKKALALIPITKPVYDMYRDMLEQSYPHLLV